MLLDIDLQWSGSESTAECRKSDEAGCQLGDELFLSVALIAARSDEPAALSCFCSEGEIKYDGITTMALLKCRD
jgi:hypothetical protein